MTAASLAATRMRGRRDPGGRATFARVGSIKLYNRCDDKPYTCLKNLRQTRTGCGGAVVVQLRLSNAESD